MVAFETFVCASNRLQSEKSFCHELGAALFSLFCVQKLTIITIVSLTDYMTNPNY